MSWTKSVKFHPTVTRRVAGLLFFVGQLVLLISVLIPMNFFGFGGISSGLIGGAINLACAIALTSNCEIRYCQETEVLLVRFFKKIAFTITS